MSGPDEEDGTDETVFVGPAPAEDADRTVALRPAAPVASAGNPAPPVEEDEQPARRSDPRRTLPVYPARAIVDPPPASPGFLDRALGPPPSAHEPPPAAPREGLPSLARSNRRFRFFMLAGFGLTLLVSAAGLWGVAALVFG